MGYADRIDPRYGPGYPNCDANHGRVSVTLDFGMGHAYDVEYQNGGVWPLLMAVADIRYINNNPGDPRSYHVVNVGHSTGADRYDVTVAGTFACRPINNPSDPGSSEPSPHSWPVAIDINPASNGWGSGNGDHPDWFKQSFLNQGFTWGGDWGDPMHYERLNWYGDWDGTYPEVDDMALTQKQSDALDFIAANMGNFKDSFDLVAGIKMGTDPKATSSGGSAKSLQAAGFRLARELNLEQQGGH